MYSKSVIIYDRFVCVPVFFTWEYVDIELNIQFIKNKIIKHYNFDLHEKHNYLTLHLRNFLNYFYYEYNKTWASYHNHQLIMTVSDVLDKEYGITYNKELDEDSDESWDVFNTFWKLIEKENHKISVLSEFSEWKFTKVIKPKHIKYKQILQLSNIFNKDINSEILQYL